MVFTMIVAIKTYQGIYKRRNRSGHRFGPNWQGPAHWQHSSNSEAKASQMKKEISVPVELLLALASVRCQNLLSCSGPHTERLLSHLLDGSGIANLLEVRTTSSKRRPKKWALPSHMRKRFTKG